MTPLRVGSTGMRMGIRRQAATIAIFWAVQMLPGLRAVGRSAPVPSAANSFFTRTNARRGDQLRRMSGGFDDLLERLSYELSDFYEVEDSGLRTPRILRPSLHRKRPSLRSLRDLSSAA